MEFVISQTYIKQKSLDPSDQEQLRITRKEKIDSILDQMSAYDHSGEEKNARAIQDAKEHICNIYSNAGINLEIDNFPKLFVFDESDRQKIFEINNLTFDADGMVYTPLGVTAVFIGAENIQISASIEHHELEHSIGRFFSVLNASRTGVGEVVGYITNNNWEVRGEALEEAIVVNNSTIFQEYSDKKNIGLVDRILLKKVTDKYDSVTKGYLPEMSMLYELVDGIKQIKGEEFSAQFIKDLIAGRIDTNRRFKMEKTIDDVYGFGTSRELLRLASGDEEGINNFTEFIKATVKKKKDV